MSEGTGMNLERELLEHYARCKHAADVALHKFEIGDPGSAAGALLNATTAALKEVIRMQTELYNAERVKLLERCMIEVLGRAEDAEVLLTLFETLVQGLEVDE